MLNKQRILITGANGQLGLELRDVLEAMDCYEAFFLNRGELPLDQTILIQDILGMYEPDIIIHTAAYTQVDRAESEADTADTINHLASEEIAQYCHVHQVKLIAISTDYVFDGTSGIALKEDAPVNPLNTYGLTKLRAEEAILKWAPDSIIIRTSWVYSVYGNNFVKTMLRLLSERSELSVVNDQVGSPTYALDLAKVILTLLMSETWKAGIYHYSNEGEISWFDFAQAIKEIKGFDCVIKPVKTAEYPTAARRPAYSLLDKSKIKQLFGIEVPFWKDSLKEMLERLAVTT